MISKIKFFLHFFNTPSLYFFHCRTSYIPRKIYAYYAQTRPTYKEIEIIKEYNIQSSFRFNLTFDKNRVWLDDKY